VGVLDWKMSTEKYRTGLKRFWAAIVDSIVFMPLLLIDRWIYTITNDVINLFVWACLVSFIPLIYSITLHYKFGQTIGKWVVGVKVFDIGETRKLTLRQSIFRDIFYLLVALVGTAYYGTLLVRTDNKEDILSNYLNFSNDPIFWWTLIELITMLTNSKRRALHDFLAKSVVIRIAAEGK
jgi:uncharacterized RDD family membrane protein YckC